MSTILTVRSITRLFDRFCLLVHEPASHYVYYLLSQSAHQFDTLQNGKDAPLPYDAPILFLPDEDRRFYEQIERFWDKHEEKISAWYLAQKRPDDLIISAAPTCIIDPIAKRLGVRAVATEYDREYGMFFNNLMAAKEKARYIIDQGFPIIENFYSDSLADMPLALCAEKAHLVTDKAQKVVDWPDMDEATMEKVHRKINTGWSIHLE